MKDNDMKLVINTLDSESKFRLFDLHSFKITPELAEFFIVGYKEDFKDLDKREISAKVIKDNVAFLLKGAVKLDCCCDEGEYGAGLYVIEVKSENKYNLFDKLEYEFTDKIASTLDVVSFLVSDIEVNVILKSDNTDTLLKNMQRKIKSECTLNVIKQETFNKKHSFIKRQTKDLSKDVGFFIDKVKDNEVIWWLTINY